MPRKIVLTTKKIENAYEALNKLTECEDFPGFDNLEGRVAIIDAKRKCAAYLASIGAREWANH